MRGMAWRALAIVIAAVSATGFWRARERAIPMEERSAVQMYGEPRTMLWAWETREDLRSLEAKRAGVAFFAGQIVLGREVRVHARREPVVIPPAVWTMAVVRLEASGSFVDSPGARSAAANAILQTAARPGIRGVQIDFDASATQRTFYGAVLREVRRTLPAEMPLSITALVSWCGRGSWLASLPIDEAVPMFFRMGGPASTGVSLPRSQGAVRAKVCAGSVGVSTDEAWPEIGG